MRRVEIQVGANGNNPGWIDGLMAFVIVVLDMLEVCRLPHAWPLIKLTREAPQIRVVGDAPDIALEVPMIDGIEADQRCEQPPIRFGDALAA